MRAAVITAVYDGYDELKPTVHQVGATVDWVCVTDDTDLPDGYLGWHVIHHPMPGIHPNRAAKRPKLLPWEYTDAHRSVWMDASFRITSPTFVVDVLSVANPLAQFVHPWRDCVYSEAQHSIGLPKYCGEPIAEQVGSYALSGHPEGWGLWATGVIARDHSSTEVRKLGTEWMDQIESWSYQDQISQPYALRKCNLRPAPLPGDHLSNPWLNYEGSVRH